MDRRRFVISSVAWIGPVSAHAQPVRCTARVECLGWIGNTLRLPALPLQSFRDGLAELARNQKVARAISLVVPQALQVRADEVLG